MLEILPKTELSVIEETLSRIGVCDKKNKILYPSCLLYKDIDSKYYIAHFKEMFLIRQTKASYNNISEEDLIKLNSIALLLEDWGLVDVISFDDLDEIETVYVYVLPHLEKKNWLIKNKFNVRTLF